MNQVLGIEDAFWEALKSTAAKEAEALGPGYYEYEFIHDEIVITFHPYKEGLKVEPLATEFGFEENGDSEVNVVIDDAGDNYCVGE